MDFLKDFTSRWLSGEDTFTVHTSGSTGIPKDITILRSDMEHSAGATNAHFAITEKSRLGSPLSAAYIAGKMMVVRACIAGAELVPLEVSNSFTLPDGTFDLLPIVPSMIPNLLENPSWAARIKNVLIGGAQPAKSSLLALHQAGYNFWISYGMTETCSHVALAQLDGIYHAMPGVSFNTDNRGCLIINAPGYSWKSLTTNDAVELLSQSSFRWLGRIDGVINSGAIKLFPEELERLYEPFLTGDFAVTSRPSERWGQEVVLVTTMDPDQANEILKANIPGIKQPKAIVHNAELPRTPNGKIDRKALGTLVL